MKKSSPPGTKKKEKGKLSPKFSRAKGSPDARPATASACVFAQRSVAADVPVQRQVRACSRPSRTSMTPPSILHRRTPGLPPSPETTFIWTRKSWR